MWFLIIILSFLVFYCDSKDYCSSQFCNHSKNHVLCKFPSPGNVSNCIDYEKLIKTEKERQDVLNKINNRRNKVASGEIHSLPAAGNMLKLVWDNELELSAQRWADQCVNISSYNSKDSCRDLENTSVGRNVATIYGESPGLTITSLIDMWYMELLNINVSVLPNYSPSSIKGLRYDYFTQLIWANTNQVGCGGVKFKEINIDSHLYQNRTVHRMVCNFAPAGNHIGQPVYNFALPCSQCNYGRNCDSEYKFLCPPMPTSIVKNTESDKRTGYVHLFHYIPSNSFNDSRDLTKMNDLTLQSNKENALLTPELIENNDTKFDFFSDLFEITKSSHIQTEKTTNCKEVLAVDEFIELLKNRLSNDHILKDLLLSTTKVSTTEPVLTDRTFAAIINQLYSKKETLTTSKSTQNDNLNSTLLVDLVEAVIFRHSDKYPDSEDTKLTSQNVPDVRPIKIQAELGEIKLNKEFTGHYFFPEEEDQTEQETTDLYDESEILPISDISLEIEDLKRNSATKDFLEEILESDFNTDNTMRDNILSTIRSLNEKNINNSSLVQYNRIKRNKNFGGSINYYDLLKKIASDLKVIKLQERYHCSHNSVEMLYNYFSLLGLIYTAFLFYCF